MYLSSSVTSIKRDAIEIWDDMSTLFPTLYKVAMKYLPIEATSVPSKGLFSEADATISQEGNRLLIQDIHSTFRRLETALKSRQIQLLHQIDVILQQYPINETGTTKCFNRINVIFDNEVEILKHVSNFGIIDFEGANLENNIYQIEENESVNCNHVCVHKCLKKIINAPDVIPNATAQEIESTEPNLFNNESVSTEAKVTAETIVKNLHSYASTLKSLQSNEDLSALAKNMDIQISVDEIYTTASDFNNIVPKLNESDLSTENSSLLHESGIENSKNSDCTVDTSFNSSTQISDHSFEFHETSPDSKGSNSNISIDSDTSKSKNFVYNRHESRYAKISLSNLIETDDIVNSNVTINSTNDKSTSVTNLSCVLTKSNDNVSDKETNCDEIVDNVSPTNENLQQKMNLEHPIQQWMQQISREPEIEPIQNNELMEHVNITTML